MSKNNVICPYCFSIMTLDDVDKNFKGNQDNYYYCENCHSAAFEKIRFGKSVFIEYEPNEN